MIDKEKIVFRLLAAIADLNNTYDAYDLTEVFEHVQEAVNKLESLIEKLDEVKS